MGKAILVIDNPDECRNCPCFNGFYFGAYCGRIDKEIEYDYNKCIYTKPDWCPLKALPEKMKVKQYCGNGVYGIVTAQEAHYAMGWNGCLDRLLDSN